MSVPDTIKYPKTFEKSQWWIHCPHCNKVIGFDGVFHWGWVLEAIGYYEGRTRIRPMDFDGVVERGFHYLIFETKEPGMDTEVGQKLTLERIAKAKSVVVMKVWGKEEPETWDATMYYPNGKIKDAGTGEGVHSAREFVKRWFAWADKIAKTESHGRTSPARLLTDECRTHRAGIVK